MIEYNNHYLQLHRNYWYKYDLRLDSLTVQHSAACRLCLLVLSSI